VKERQRNVAQNGRVFQSKFFGGFVGISSTEAALPCGHSYVWLILGCAVTSCFAISGFPAQCHSFLYVLVCDCCRHLH
jgi:hypothetical protein